MVDSVTAMEYPTELPFPLMSSLLRMKLPFTVMLLDSVSWSSELEPVLVLPLVLEPSSEPELLLEPLPPL